MTNPGAGDVPGTSEKPQKPRHPAAKARPATRARAKDAGAKEKKAKPAHSTVGHAWIWMALVALSLASGGSVAAIWFLEKAARDAQTAGLEALVQSASPVQIAQQQDAKTAALEARVAALEQKVSRLPDLSSAKELEATTGLLAEKIDGLSGRISELEKAPLGTAGGVAQDEARREAQRSAGELDSLKERVAALEQAKEARVPPETIERNQALVVAVGQLREALGASKPFAPELSAVTNLGGAGVARIADAVAPYAEQGVATVAELREGFPKVARDVVRAAGAAQDGDWIDKALAEASNVVTVRKVGEVEGDTPEALVARAEARLAADDLAGAIEQMSRLSGPPAEAAKDWVAKAAARAAAEKALKDLHLQVIGQIAQSDGSQK